MLIIVSSETYWSPWVPFEIAYAYENKGDKLKLLRHKGINKATLPSYLKTKEILNGTHELNNFISKIRTSNYLYESLIQKGEKINSFSNYDNNPLNKYLDNE